jgi:5-methylcytosine-specific restriction endonuclease McrA
MSRTFTWSAARALSPSRWCAIWYRDGGTCAHCGQWLPRRYTRGPWIARAPSIDHARPRSEFFGDARAANDPKNLVLSCVGCNAARREGRRSFADYLAAKGSDIERSRREVRNRTRRKVSLRVGRVLAEVWFFRERVRSQRAR